jgi:hypothetical protein
MTSPCHHVRALMMGTASFFVGVLTVSTSSCALGGRSGISSTDARTSLYSVLDDTQEILGGTWSNQDDPTPRGCSVSLWSEGELFPALRVGEPPDRPEAAVTAVSTYWTDLGHTLETTDVGEVAEVQATNDRGERLILRLSEGAMTLQGESECRPRA